MKPTSTCFCGLTGSGQTTYSHMLEAEGGVGSFPEIVRLAVIGEPHAGPRAAVAVPPNYDSSAERRAPFMRALAPGVGPLAASIEPASLGARAGVAVVSGRVEADRAQAQP